MQNPGEWETSEEVEIAWLDDAYGRLIEEIGCAQEHWNTAKSADVRGDEQEHAEQMYVLAKHFENLRAGIEACHHVIVERFCGAGVVAQLVIDKLTVQTGQEFKIVQTLDDGSGTFSFLLERQEIVVPDDISEVEGL